MEPAPRTHTVTLPSWMAERLFACYYGAGPRFHEDQPMARIAEPPTDAPPQAPVRVDPPTIPANLQSMPPTITGLVGGGKLIPRGVAARKPRPDDKG